MDEMCVKGFVPWANSTRVICGCDLKERSYEKSAGREGGGCEIKMKGRGWEWE